MEIIKLEPAFQNYLWGGTKLKTLYNKKCDFDRVAESWELSTHPAGESTVAAGKYKGLKLSEYIEKTGKSVLGKHCAAFSKFPVLIKLIDAKNPLSIQVHPSDEYAMRVEKEYGKTELWYVLDCEENASLYFGVNREISKEEFRAKIKDNTILDVLNQVPVHRGDVFFIEAGTIHAIGAGILICEIQQNSNTTYRVYDYDRRDANGNARELHIDKATDVCTLVPSKSRSAQEPTEQLNGYTKRRLASCTYFTSQLFQVSTSCILQITDDSFSSIVFTQGKGTLSSDETRFDFEKGESYFVPAKRGTVTVSGDCEFILTTV
ncbi:MAG TPA: type I phosphomannose isomerase catalytic subunit [Oscillospiraceae bacterium]|nr:type I phosphomannose isomerase catalytic subunit [Oscillospiraceae bacterium]